MVGFRRSNFVVKETRAKGVYHVLIVKPLQCCENGEVVEVKS